LQDLPKDLLPVVIAMRGRGVSVAEEQVLDDLVGDLTSSMICE
jgi:hypothetical protein